MFPICAVLLQWSSTCAMAAQPTRICEISVGLLAADFVYRVPNSELARVAIRQCEPPSNFVQLVAWASHKSEPSLVLDTDDFGVVQTVARGNVYVIETGGGSRDQVFVIVYQLGIPKLALRRTTKGSASILVNDRGVKVVISGIYAGDAAPKTEEHWFTLDPEGNNPK